MPKLLKSLFPARDDKKELRPSPHNQQVSRDPVAELAAGLLSDCVIGQRGLVGLANGTKHLTLLFRLNFCEGQFQAQAGVLVSLL